MIIQNWIQSHFEINVPMPYQDPNGSEAYASTAGGGGGGGYHQQQRQQHYGQQQQKPYALLQVCYLAHSCFNQLIFYLELVVIIFWL